MQDACRRLGIGLRVHFKSLKCGSLAQYLQHRGVRDFLCAKLNEAEVLADAGINDILIANEIVTPLKIRRLVALARRTPVTVCVDDLGNVSALSAAADEAGVRLGVLIEVDIGMRRCGVAPGMPAVDLAREITRRPSLRFRGLQGYDGHLQLVNDPDERESRCRQSLQALDETRRRLEEAGIAVEMVTGGGTGTWEWVASHEAITEIQPGSFLLMDAVYHRVRPEFACSLSILATVISRGSGQYILDAGSKAISQDFGLPTIKSRPLEKLTKLAEEHAFVECAEPPAIGEQREVFPAHCCATMNLHRVVAAVRKRQVESFWPIEASGRYD
jgi:D-serine deaminase-like pyridoxal phosphate-dependent protein